MPSFNVDSVRIDPEEYVNECSECEIRELINEIRDNYADIFEEEIKDDVDEAIQNCTDDIRSEGHRIYINHLNTLKREWYSVTKEDAEIIAILAKKYGAL
jgi:hypothetical protein